MELTARASCRSEAPQFIRRNDTHTWEGKEKRKNKRKKIVDCNFPRVQSEKAVFSWRKKIKIFLELGTLGLNALTWEAAATPSGHWHGSQWRGFVDRLVAGWMSLIIYFLYYLKCEKVQHFHHFYLWIFFSYCARLFSFSVLRDRLVQL